MIYTALKTPGVYVNEISIFPPSVAQVPTAIPAFIGYTERHEMPNGDSLQMKPTKISSLIEYQLYYGSGPKLIFDKATGNGVELDANNQVVKANNKQSYYLFDSMQMFFANGGGDCYIIAVEKYRGDGTVQLGSPTTGMTGGLEVVKEVDEPTMLVFPDAVSLPTLDLYTLQATALGQCIEMMDRVGVFDIKRAEDKTALTNNVKEFRDNIGMTALKYGGVYAPWLKVGIKKEVHYSDLKDQIVKAGTALPIDLTTLVLNYSPADEAIIKGLINALNQLVDDNNFMNTVGVRSIKNYLAAASNALYKPTGYVGDLPTIRDAFDLVVQSLLNKLADADADSTLATKSAKVDVAATEFMKLLRQTYHMVTMIDDFTFLDPSFIKNSEFRDLGFTTIKYSANKTPIGGPANDFDKKVIELWNWDKSSLSTAAPVTNAIFSGAPPFAALSGQLPFNGLNYDVITWAGFGAPTAGLFTNDAPGAASLATEAIRIQNMRTAYPKIRDLFNYFYNILQSILSFGESLLKAKEDALLKTWPVYKGIVDSVNNNLTILPPSGAMAGIYSRVDNERGVWKAPANVSVTLAKGTLVNITDKIQESLNVDVDAGKSVNAIRVFSGKGTMVWGARTLAGNDNEWRYISVRRFFNMVEESVKKSTSWVVFEPNDANTWLKVKSMIENYLTLLWRQGALAGAKPDEAFRVYVGLNQTMTAIDILEGRMIIRIEMAAVRPAEFIILEFAHKLQTS